MVSGLKERGRQKQNVNSEERHAISASAVRQRGPPEQRIKEGVRRSAARTPKEGGGCFFFGTPHAEGEGGRPGGGAKGGAGGARGGRPGGRGQQDRRGGATRRGK